MKRDYSDKKHHRTNNQTPPNRQCIWIYIITILIIVFLGWLFLFSPIFNLKKITISGTTDNELINQVEQFIYTNIRENSNFFLFSTTQIISELSNNSEIQTISVIKKLPNRLEVSIETRIPDLVIKQNEHYFLVQDGLIEGEVDPNKIKWDLPIMIINYDLDFEQKNNFLNKQKIDFIKEFYTKKTRATGVELTNFEIGEEGADTLRIHTSQDWYLYLNFNNNIDNIIENLNILLQTKLKEEKPVEYIDMRLEDKVFYK